MKQNWVLIAGIVAVLAIPFGLAAFEDSTKEPVPKDDRDEDFHDSSLDNREDRTHLLYPRGDNTVAEWETEEPLDLSFLEDYLATTPGLSPAVAAANESDGALDEFDTDSPHWEATDLARYTTGSSLATVAIIFEADFKVLYKLKERWGEPTRRASPPGRSASWETGTPGEDATRVVFSADGDPQRILVGPMTTIESILGQGFFGKRARYKSIGALEKAFPDRSTTEDSLESRALYFPPVAESLEPSTEIWFSVEESSDQTLAQTRITNVSLAVQLDLAPRTTNEMLALLKKAFGKPRASEFGGDALELLFPNHPGLYVFLYPNRLVVEQAL